MQRDLTDSTILRNLGSCLGYSLLAYNSTIKGLGKITINEAIIKKDLEDNWVVIGEGIQTILRREGHEEAYDQLKNLTRGNTNIAKDELNGFIDKLPVANTIKEELKNITVTNYIGYSNKLISTLYDS
jgi:adenylosuccinate lyase